MTFGAPWALLGLLALALPIAIHLLSRHRARRQLFPTLRFIPIAPILPRRRIELTDAALLAIRVSIVALAVFALAQPRFVGRSATGLAAGTSRLLIVDSSSSMARPTGASRGTALDSANAVAMSLANEGDAALVVSTTRPGDVIAAGVEWLSRQPGKREVVIISDFQAGTIDSVDLAQLPADIGMRLLRIPTIGSAGPLRATRSGMARSVQVTVDHGHTVATWSPAPQVPSPRADTIIYMDDAGRAEPTAAARPLNEPWMAVAVQRLHDDPALLAAAALTSSRATGAIDERFSVVASDTNGRPLAVASSGSINGQTGLELFLLADRGTILASALDAALSHSVDNSPEVEELDPTYVPLDQLRRWERTAASGGPAPSDASDARWLWAGVLVLLLLEWLVRNRRSPAASTSNSSEMERAA